ncbi:GNAT family N-acetyltransferase [Clostridium sp. Marseille-QA1073]
MLIPNLLKGDRVKLSALKKEDVDKITMWHEDVDFLRNYDGKIAYPETKESIEKWYEETINSKENFCFSIITLEEKNMIGFLVLSSIMWNNGSSWISICIGDEKNRKKGYGSEALRLLIDYSFRELNLYRLQLTVFSYNTSAIKTYEKLGFKKEGVYREAIYRDNNRYDMYLYGLLKKEWCMERYNE